MYLVSFAPISPKNKAAGRLQSFPYGNILLIVAKINCWFAHGLESMSAVGRSKFSANVLEWTAVAAE